jgi:hypothetical protein
MFCCFSRLAQDTPNGKSARDDAKLMKNIEIYSLSGRRFTSIADRFMPVGYR